MRIKRKIILILCAALALGFTASAEVDIYSAYDIATRYIPKIQIDLVDQPDYVGGKGVRIALSEDGKDYEIWWVFETQRKVKCIFFGLPESYTVPEGQRDNFLKLLNNINAEETFPTVYLADSGIPAGHASITLPKDGEETLKLFMEDTIDASVFAMKIISESACYDRVAPTAKPTSAPKVTAAPSNTASSGTSASGGHLEYYYEDTPCFNCYGTGTCPLCHGTGTYRMYGQSVPCDRQCSACSGSGVIPSLRSRWVAD